MEQSKVAKGQGLPPPHKDPSLSQSFVRQIFA